MTQPQDLTNRRDFLKAGTAAAVTASFLATGVYAAGSDEIKVGIIGCGSRGKGAGDNVLHAAKNVTIHAIGDAFENRLNDGRRSFENAAKEEKVKELGNKVD